MAIITHIPYGDLYGASSMRLGPIWTIRVHQQGREIAQTCPLQGMVGIVLLTDFKGTA